jgi:hypothetical protein
MARSSWDQAEEVLFEQSQSIIRQFSLEHPDEWFSLFAYSVDSEYAGVALNFDTPVNSLHRAKRHQRDRVKYLNELFASQDGWKNARYHVANPTNQIDDFNRGSWRYELVQFVPLPACEEYFNSCEEAPELEGRIIVSLWRVIDLLIEARAFDGLRRMPPFRLGFAFHDDNFVVLRILDWPDLK